LGARSPTVAACESTCIAVQAPSDKLNARKGVDVATQLETSPAPPQRRGTKRWWPLFVVGAGALLGITLLFGLLTQGTFDPGVRATRDPQALFYDAQARSLLHGRLDVPPGSLGGEAITFEGRTYGYFGVGPALLRLPVMLVSPRGDPNLAPWSFLGAFVVEALAAFGIWCAVKRRWGLAVPPIVDGAFLFAVLAASPNVFLTARPDVYEEAILWGVAASLVTFWALLRVLETSSWRWGAVAVIAAVFAVLSRPTVGCAALLAVGASAVVLAARDRSRWRLSLSLAGGAVFGLVAFCVVNYLKFHRLASAPHNANYLAQPKRLAALEHGGTLGIRYLPTNLVQYLRPDTLHLGGAFPWVTFRMTQYAHVLEIGHVHFDTFELPTSISATAPILLAFAVVGSIAILRRPSVLVIPLGASVVALVLVASFFAETPRYLAEFLPWLVIGSAVGLAVVVNWEPRRRWMKPSLWALGVLALLWSVFVSASLAHVLAHAYRTHDYFLGA
jgi:Dolichyl-phosphate-mannose-protein mannosyltransferase